MTDKKRQPRHKRSPNPSPMRLTARDKDIIHAVHRYRVLRQNQIEKLFFGTDSATQRVLRRLYEHGFLERKFLPVVMGMGNSPTMYVLDKKGAELLRSEYGLDDLVWYPSSKELKTEFLEHTTAINDFRIAVTLAAKNYHYALLKWVGELELKADYERVTLRTSKGEAQSVSLIPDSYFALNTPHGFAHFFLEVDLGTEATQRFKTKIAAYSTYYASGAYEKRYNTKSMRILTITNSLRRLKSLKAATEEIGGKRRFWFAVNSEITQDNIFNLPLWHVAGQQEVMTLIDVPQ